MKFIKLFAILSLITISQIFSIERISKNMSQRAELKNKIQSGNGKTEFISKFSKKKGTATTFTNPNPALELTPDDMCEIEYTAQQYCLNNSRSETYLYFTEKFQESDPDIIPSSNKWTDLYNQKHIFEVILPATIGSLNFKTEPLLLVTGTKQSRMKANAAYLNRIAKIGQSNAGDVSDALDVGSNALGRLTGGPATDISVGSAQAGVGLLGVAIKEFTMLALHEQMMKNTVQGDSARSNVRDNKRCTGSSNTLKQPCNRRRKY